MVRKRKLTPPKKALDTEFDIEPETEKLALLLGSKLTIEDLDFMEEILGGGALREPDLVISPEDTPYLLRWHIIPKNDRANIFMHLQLASDPERPLHDHPWDNTSVIISGGYEEVVRAAYSVRVHQRKPGDVVHRLAETAHRLILPEGTPYTLTIFSTGPKRQEWGFYAKGGWVPASELIENRGNVSVYKEGE